MNRATRFLCLLLAFGAALFVGLGTLTLGQTAAGKLTIQLTNVVEEPIVDYENVRVPIAPAADATSTVPVICYCGPALLLSVQDCGTNFVRIESSTDLKNWSAFPQPGFQLTLSVAPAAIPVENPSICVRWSKCSDERYFWQGALL